MKRDKMHNQTADEKCVTFLFHVCRFLTTTHNTIFFHFISHMFLRGEIQGYIKKLTIIIQFYSHYSIFAVITLATHIFGRTSELEVYRRKALWNEYVR